MGSVLGQIGEGSIRAHFGVTLMSTLGSLWGNFGFALVSLWDECGVRFGSFLIDPKKLFRNSSGPKKGFRKSSGRKVV